MVEKKSRQSLTSEAKATALFTWAIKNNLANLFKDKYND